MDSDKILLEIYGKVEAVSSDVKHIDSKLQVATEQHEAMWKKIDSHGKWINRMKGVVAAVGALLGIVIYWVKHKFGGGH